MNIYVHTAYTQVIFNPPTTAILENSAEGTDVSRVTAIDAYTKSNTGMRYYLIGQSRTYFKIDENTGQIEVLRGIDRENLKEHRVFVQAKGPTSTGVGEILVSVLDTNDNSPGFAQSSYTITVSETTNVGTTLYRVVATDADVSPNNQIIYTMDLPDSKFTVNPVSGDITLLQPLDYETAQSHQVVISVANTPAASTSNTNNKVTVTIIVEDYNDNCPQFSQNVYVKNVTENSLGQTLVFSITPSDSDLSQNLKDLKCSISEPLALEYFTVTTAQNLCLVQLTKPLDYETNTEFRFALTATNNAGAGKTPCRSSTNLLVNVLDVPDQAVRLDPINYIVNISESEVPGSVAVIIRAIGPSNSLQFALQGSTNDLQKFTINQQSGEVILTNPVDREIQDKYFFNVTVTDGVTSALGTVQINILDVNDNAPRFFNLGNQQCYQRTLSEATPTNTEVFQQNQILALDTDIGQNGQFEFSLLPTSTCHSLEIDANTGAVRTNKPLDFEARDVIHCLIKAEDKGSPSLSGYSCLTLTLANANDEKPEFTVKAYNVELQESVPFNTMVTVVHATDKDGPQVLYSIVKSTPVNAPFKIDAVTGKITTDGILDYESVRDYTLEIRATDTGTPQLSADQNAIINIKVTAVNDNRPVFGQNYYRVTVAEDTEIGTSVLNVVASDGDHQLSPLHKTLVYSSLDNTTDFRVVSNTGAVLVNKPLDFERKRSYSLVVVVRDSANLYLSSRAMVDITIEDVNDNVPIFQPASYNIRISEKTLVGTSLLTVSAKDNDAADNDNLRYSIISGDLGFFELNQNGVGNQLVLKKEVDHEIVSQRRFVLTLGVTDGSSVNNAIVSIDVIDVNDREAIFDLSYYEGTVQENFAAFAVVPVVTVRALDKDFLTENQNLVYSIVDDTPDAKHFRIEKNNQGQGVIYATKSFDYEEQQEYTFLVKASDTAHENLTGIASVNIKVTDLNDNAPLVENRNLIVNISESTKVFTTIAIIFASDLDSGNNGALTYTILNHPAPETFRINPETGVIELVRQLDYLVQNTYKFNVLVQDRGTPQVQQSIVEVTVYVHRTVLAGIRFQQKHYVFNVVDRENKPNVGTIQAVDTGSYVSQQINYEVVAGISEISGMFNVLNATRTGLVTMVSTALPDYDQKDKYSFMVKAINERGAVDYAQVTINVIDKNEPTRFIGTDVNGRYVFDVIESISVPSYVFGVIVRDDDDGVNANLKFTLQNPAGGSFSIDEFGRIQILQQPDREKQSSYIFTVSVQDSSSSPITTSVQIICNVLDYNDNRPIFYPQGVRSVTITERSTEQIMTLFANDTDLGVNRQVVYSNIYPLGHLNVDENTGVVRVSTPFDYESGDRYEFVAVAKDSGSPYLSSYQRIVVNVININDHTPFFPRHDYNVSISEVSPVGTTFFQIHAFDEDRSTPGLIDRYEMTAIPRPGSGAGGADDSFRITPDGMVYVNKPLDANVRDVFEYRIKAYDQGTPQRNSEDAILRINIDEHSELQPRFLLDHYIVNIFENTTVATSILQVEATSPEKNLAGSLEYKVISNTDTDSFQLDINSGRLISIRDFDFETKKQFIFEVEALDTANQKTNRAQVIVNILDVNDNNPLFTQNAYNYNISEATRPGQIITILQATDRDSEDNGRFVFSGVGGDLDKFSVNSNGQVILMGPLDHRLKNTYEIDVKVEDLGNPKLSSLNKITVFVHKADLKLNTPIFVAHLYKKCVDENVAPIDLVQVNATNTFPISGSRILYNINQALSPAESSPFEVNAVTGQIRLRTPLDYESKKSYDFLVIATNEENRQDIAVVSICVNDVDDNRAVLTNARVNISESAEIGTIVHAVQVTDADKTIFDHQREFRISSVSGADQINRFSIDNNGVIKLASKIDYEAIKNNPVYTLTIIMTENNQISVGTVTVDITDWNDNRPDFINNAYTFNLNRQYQIQEQIGTIFAIDADGTANNNQIQYSIMTTDTHFEMLGSSLRLREQLDYDGESFEFVVIATDNGYLNLRESVLVKVNVADLNNHPPVFAPVTYENTVSEAAPLTTTVIRVYATDIDAYPSASIRYVLSDSSVPFQIDTDGYITLTRTLNYEARQLYVFNVTALDDGNQQSSNYATVTISVTDVNEHQPVFDLLYYERSFPEDQLVNSVLLTVNAEDEDKTSNTITYSMVQTNVDQQSFSMDQNSGEIRLLRPFDYEIKKHYTFNIQARDSATNRLSGVAHITFKVTDVNDNSPRFIDYAEYAYNVTVEDNIHVGTLLTVLSTSDADSGLNAKIDYNIESGNIDDKFTLDQNGQIRLRNPLDAKVQNKHVLLISATDNGTPKLSARHNVTINVLEYTDSIPVFNPSLYQRTVSEEIQVGSSLVDLIYTKTKPGSKVTLSFHPHTMFPEFRLNGDRIELAQPLDYERQNLYSMIVLATDEVNDVAVAQVVINVLNLNEHAPVFAPQTIVRSISEHAFIGHSILQLSAQDADANDQQTYRVSGTIPNNYFTLSPSGVLTVARELTPGTYTFNAVANDGKFDSTNQIQITIVVTPETDLIFRKATYTVDVPEDRALQSLIVSTSAGDDPNIVYDITDLEAKDTFTMDSTGNIRLIKKLNFDVRRQYIFSLDASLSTPIQQRALATVVVNVIEVNDHPPVFQQQVYRLNVSEDTLVGTPIVTVKADDLDTIPKQLTYSIISGSLGKFAIDPVTGEITVAGGLNWDDNKFYVLGVRASDGVSQDDARVEVTITPVNKPGPQFTEAVYVKTILENFSTNSPDNLIFDNIDHINGVAPFVYLINEQSGRDYFDLSQNGDIRLIRSVNYEQQKQHRFTITVQGKRQTGRATVIVNIENINDVCPKFNEQSSVSTYNGNPPINGLVHVVKATDDDNLPFTFTIQSGNNEKYFKIDGTSGEIRAIKTFPKSYKNTFFLNIAAEDGVCRPITHLAQIIIDTCADPQEFHFKRPKYVFYLREDRVLGDFGRVDLTSNRPASLHILTAGITHFTLNNAGNFSLVQSLDYETTPKYSFIISANFTEGTVALADVEVIVEDINDNCPRFTETEIVTHHTEPIAKDTIVALTTVNDVDTVGQITYTLVGDPHFTIDNQGRVITSQLVNDEVRRLNARTYELTATVFDGRCSHSTRIKIMSTKILLDLYRFAEPYYYYEIGEEQKVPFLINRFRNVGGFPAKYYLLESNDHFSLNETTGEMSLVKKLDYDIHKLDEKRYYLRLEVRFDIGYKARTTVIVEIKDDNDITPDLLLLPPFTVITPNYVKGSLVSRTRVSDPDTESSFSYCIKSGDADVPIFTVTPMGNIETIRCITDADINIYELTVDVFDGKHNFSRSLIVRIIRSEDRSFENNCGLDCREYGHPSIYTFTRGLYSKTLPENTPANTFIEQAIVPAFNDVSYKLSSEADGLFTIDSNGTITSLVSFDYEQRQYYSFKVTASIPTPVTPEIADMEAGVVIIIENKDDASPVLVSNPTRVTVSELTQTNAAIGCIKVTDQDTNPSNLIYTLTNNQGLFKIDQNGDIRVNTSLQTKAGESFKISYEVSDGKNTPLQGEFNVVVVDENDQLPVFNSVIYETTMIESSPIGSSVIRIGATDADTGSQISYSLVEPSSVFQIDPLSGLITLKSKLDFGTARVHEFLVAAKDRGSLSSQSIVKVTVTDVLDAAPVLASNPVTGRVSEYALIGASIAKIIASDADTGDTMTYQLDQSSQYLHIFEIDASTGVLKLRKRLYQYREEAYSIGFTVKDTHGSSTPGRFDIQVQRSTVNPCPDFVGSHSIELFENATLGTFITSVLPSPAQDYYSLLEYTIHDDSGNNMFAIDLDGKVTLAKSLDYEQHNIHTITVDAYDTIRKFNSSVIFFVKVKDVNEFAPIISSSAFTISEQAPIGTPVGTVEISDQDGDSTATFSLAQGGDNDKFTISPDSGLISVNGELDSGLRPTYTVKHALMTVYILQYVKTSLFQSPMLITNNQHSILTPTFSLSMNQLLVNLLAKLTQLMVTEML
uniref:Cadherin domain-containing protein n=2 Tax=Clytia hemisphaerica TaxID=252671 RepID=A0A7M5X211_9CNID